MIKTTRECEVYQFDSMEDINHPVAQAAIEKYRENAEYIYDCELYDAVVAAKCFGFNVDVYDICWSGFWSQGDGASIEGEWNLEDVKDVVECVKSNFPQDEELNKMAENFAETIDGLTVEFVSIKRMYFTRYCHENTLGVENYQLKDEYDEEYEAYEEDAKRDAEYILDIMKELSGWLYARLEKSYDYQDSDEAIMETLIANEYEFDEDGNIV